MKYSMLLKAHLHWSSFFVNHDSDLKHQYDPK